MKELWQYRQVYEMGWILLETISDKTSFSQPVHLSNGQLSDTEILN